MWLTRLAFWYLPDPPFTGCLGGFGPKLDPSSERLAPLEARRLVSGEVRPSPGLNGHPGTPPV